MDSCSVILLAKASVLETVLDNYPVSVTLEVFDEVMKGKAQKFQDALLFERLHNLKKIKIIKANLKLSEKIKQDFNMGKGEASVIAAGIGEKETIVATDNRQGRKAALINNFHLIGSIELVVILYKRKKINHDKAIHSLKILEQEGWFDPNLIQKAKEDLHYD